MDISSTFSDVGVSAVFSVQKGEKLTYSGTFTGTITFTWMNLGAL